MIRPLLDVPTSVLIEKRIDVENRLHDLQCELEQHNDWLYNVKARHERWLKRDPEIKLEPIPDMSAEIQGKIDECVNLMAAIDTEIEGRHD